MQDYFLLYIFILLFYPHYNNIHHHQKTNNKRMKLSPLTIIFFFFLLMVFIVGLDQYYKPSGFTANEGFISFGSSTTPLQSYTTIPTYSTINNELLKLYDNVFYDTKNASIIEISETAATTTSTADPNKISALTVKKRDGTEQIITTALDNSGNVVPFTASRGDTVASSFTQWSYNTTTTTTDKYQVIYIAWDLTTYIHILNLTTNTDVLGVVFYGKEILDSYIFNSSPISITETTAYAANANDGKMVAQPLYNNKSVYQITQFLQFDTTNGCVLVLDTSGNAVQVYDRSHETAGIDKSTLNTIVNTNNNQQWVHFVNNSYAVYYVAIGSFTLIHILQKVGTSYAIVKIARFNTAGIVLSGGSPTSSPRGTTPSPAVATTTPAVPAVSGGSTPAANSGDYQSTFLSNFVSSVYNSPNLSAENAGQIGTAMGQFFVSSYSNGAYVPPISIESQQCCPNCPKTGGVCNFCGGGGGCGLTGVQLPATTGTTTTQQQPAVSTGTSSNIAGNSSSGSSSGITGLIRDGGDGTLEIARDAGGGATSIARDTVGGGVQLTKDAASGGVNLVKDAGSETVSLIKEFFSGVADLLKYFGSGINVGNNPYGVGSSNDLSSSSHINQNPSTGIQQNQPIPSGLGNDSVKPIQGVDLYNQYGALQGGGNSSFMPITASFSQFA